jgi:hypothetical protein
LRNLLLFNLVSLSIVAILRDIVDIIDDGGLLGMAVALDVALRFIGHQDVVYF